MAIPAVNIGPFQNIVEVGWGGQIDLIVNATTAFNHGSPGTRTAKVELSDEGIRCGGKITGEDTVAQGFYYSYTAGVRFSRMSSLGVTAMFRLKLSGASIYKPGGQPPPMVPPFCGRSTETAALGPYYATANPPNPNFPGAVTHSFWQDWNYTATWPGGSSAAQGRNGPLAMVGMENVGGGAVTRSNSYNSIWYQDAAGNWINTGASCDQLPEPGKPPIDPQLTEGWGFMVDGPAKVWVGPRFEGANIDFQPIWNDIGDGTYEFGLLSATFLNVPRAKPNDPPYSTIFPLLLNKEQYSFSLENGYSPPRVPMPGVMPIDYMDKRFPPGGTPPLNETLAAT